MLLAYIATGGVYSIHVDHLGTPQMLTDGAGAVVWDAVYRPFGEAAVSGSVAFNLRFPGQYFDDETGLHYNYFRDYDPKTGRYLQSDPIGLRGGWNTYAYVGGNPVMRVDPEGLQTTATGGGIGAVPGVIPGSEGNQGLAEDLKKLLGLCWRFAKSGLPFDPGDDDDCQRMFAECLDTALADEPGSVWGQSRCGFCKEVCVREGAWPQTAPTTSGSVRCDYWNC